MHLSYMKRELLVQVSRELGAHEDIHGFRFLGYDPRTSHAGKEPVGCIGHQTLLAPARPASTRNEITIV